MTIQRTRKAVIYMLLLLLSLAPVAITQAQDDDVQGDLDLFGVSLDVEGVVIQNAAGGTFTEIEIETEMEIETEIEIEASAQQGFYLLRLEGVEDGDTDVVQLGNAAPVSYTTTALALDWARAAGEMSDATEMAAEMQSLDDLPYVADAELTSEEATVFMTIVAMTLEEGTGVPLYTVRVEQVIPPMMGEDIDFDNVLALLDKAELPTRFGPATLTISGSELFWTTLASSARERAAVIRADTDHNLALQCEAAENPQGQNPDADYSALELEIIQKWYNDNCMGS